MKQLTQRLKTGIMEILEVPFPVMGKDNILVENHYSVISAGTESKTVSDARKGYFAKARSRQKEVRMVIDSILSDGLRDTYDLVMNKLNAPSSLGYSSAGKVIAVGENIKDIKVGDHVACGGDGAVHAQVVSIPRNLCVKIRPEVDLRHAAFTTIASIAIQGIRQADLRFGENCVVIGLGLIGQITIQLLHASGIRAIGIDIDLDQVKEAEKNGAYLAANRNDPGIEETIAIATYGHGADAVIITAGTSSLDPVEFAGEICRKKGRVIIVGSVPTGFSRKNYYRKELELKMSSSYGPGRYDNNYELKGMDYPVGYVRFTENRNMQTFVDFLEQGSLQMEQIISHEFKLENAKEAYEMILEKDTRVSGILLKYDVGMELVNKVIYSKSYHKVQEVNIGLIGAGSFAQSTMLPLLKGKCNLTGVSTTEGNISHYVAEKYGFSFATDSPDEIIDNENINTVFILTRHDMHAELVIKALESGKSVYVEKPLAMNLEELEKVRRAYNNSNGQLMLGFNRRFSPFVREITDDTPELLAKSISMRINAGMLPGDHWVHDPEFGGGRIIGEACHFIDLAMHLSQSPINSVSAYTAEDSLNLMDTATINLKFENGSVASLGYFSNGHKKVPKERIEVFCGGKVYLIDDFRKMTTYGKKISRMKLGKQDKGHRIEIDMVLDAIRSGKEMPIEFNEIYNSSLATFKAIESMRTGRTIKI